MENEAVNVKKPGAAKDWIYGVIAEASFFAFLYYVQVLLNVGANLWISTSILWALMNLSVIFCPFLRRRRF